MVCAIHMVCAIQVYINMYLPLISYLLRHMETLHYTSALCRLHHIVSLSLPFSPTLPPPLSHIHCDVLQCSLRQIRHSTAVRLLPFLGSCLVVPEVCHLERDPRQHGSYHCTVGQ